jgi:hypothetical protein
MSRVIEKQFKGNIGVHLVAAKLFQMNLIALTTSRNTRGYDIVVFNPATNRGKGIQVKCTDKEEFPVMQSFLKDYAGEVDRKILSDFIFVDISIDGSPSFFILPRDEMRLLLKKTIQKWIDGNHRKPIEDMIRDEKKKQQWAIATEDLTKYRNNWTSLTETM